MIKRYEIKINPHDLGIAQRIDFPISQSIGHIVGICVIPKRNESSENGFGLIKSLYDQEVIKGNQLANVSISTDMGELLVNQEVLIDAKETLKKRMVPVDYRHAFSRLSVVIDETSELDEEKREELALPKLKCDYELSVFLKIHKPC